MRKSKLFLRKKNVETVQIITQFSSIIVGLGVTYFNMNQAIRNVLATFMVSSEQNLNGKTSEILKGRLMIANEKWKMCFRKKEKK